MVTTNDHEDVSTESILTAVCIETLGQRCFLLGGGGVYFWTRYFNTSLVGDLPSSLTASSSPSCSLFHKITLNTRKRATPSCTSNDSERVGQPDKDGDDDALRGQQGIVIVRDPSKLKEIKTLLESLSLYDKTRKITRVQDGVFAVPVLDDLRTKQSLQSLPASLLDVISLSNASSEGDLSIQAKKSYSQKNEVEQRLTQWCQQGRKG